MASPDREEAGEVVDFVPNDPRPSMGIVKSRDVARFLSDSSRLRVFLTMAGLVEAGIGLGEAAELIADEYEAAGILKDAASIKGFFAAASLDVEPEKLREVARDAFGATFVGIEELLLLSILPRSSDKAATLRAIAGLISLKDAKGGSHAHRKP